MADRTISTLAFGGVVAVDKQIIVLGVGQLPGGESVTVGIELNKVQRALVRSRIERLDNPEGFLPSSLVGDQ